MYNKMSEETIDRVLHDLRVIGAIREHEKIYMQNGRLQIDRGCFYSPIHRYIKGEGRVQTVTAISSVIADAFAISENSFKNIETKEDDNSRENTVTRLKYYHLICKLRSGVSDCLVGTKNLRATYVDDTSITARIDVLKDRITQGLKEVDASISILKKDFDAYEEILPRYGEYLAKDSVI